MTELELDLEVELLFPTSVSDERIACAISSILSLQGPRTCSRSQTETIPSSVPTTRLGNKLLVLCTSPIPCCIGKAGDASNGPGAVCSNIVTGATIVIAVIRDCVVV